MTEVSEAVLTYDWNGQTHPMSGAHLSDMEVAARVRMLMRDQLNHEGVCELARDRIMALSKEVARLTAALAVAPKLRVRKLEWADTGPGYIGGSTCAASSMIGRYFIDQYGTWCVYFDNRLQSSGHESADAAKAAAQADYERRILAALEDGQEAEYVAEQKQRARPSPTGEKVEAGTRREIEFHLDRMNAWLRDLWAVRDIDLHMCDGSTKPSQRGLLCDIRDDVGAMRATIAALEAERDELRGYLDNLLARIHRDGGHYTAKHGTSKAVADADLIVSDMLVSHDALATAERERDDLATKWQQAIAIGMLHAVRTVTAESALATANARVERLETELAWYGEQARLARFIAGRNVLQSDGGDRARAALTGGENG